MVYCKPFTTVKQNFKTETNLLLSQMASDNLKMTKK
jgi:hypothetical protein